MRGGKDWGERRGGENSALSPLTFYSSPPAGGRGVRGEGGRGEGEGEKEGGGRDRPLFVS